jgi:hypothetical protein
VSRSDWDTHVRRVPVADGHLEAGPLPRPDPHVAVVLLPRGQQVRLLLVPPDFSEYHAAEAMLAACTRGNTHTAAQLLEEVVDQPDDDPWQVWS